MFSFNCCSGAASASLVERLSEAEPSTAPTCVSCDTSVQNVTYVSDVEGAWDYFCNFVSHSKGLNFASEAEPNDRREAEDFELFLDEGWHFVYGGDACDKGPGTLRFLEAMVRLKKKCPGRVHLLLGNGDVNRLGWALKLKESEFGHPKDATMSLWSQADVPKSGSKEFAQRREELALLEGTVEDEVPDDQVIASFRQCLQHSGWLYEYLQRAQLGVLLGETLFVDGQVIANGGEEAEMGNGEDLREWLIELNDWYCKSVKDLDGKHESWDPIPSREA